MSHYLAIFSDFKNVFIYITVLDDVAIFNRKKEFDFPSSDRSY